VRTTNHYYAIPLRLRGADQCPAPEPPDELLGRGRRLLRELLSVATCGFGMSPAEITKGLTLLVRYGRGAAAILDELKKVSRI